MKKIEKVKKILNDNNIKYYDVGYSESGKFIDILYKDLELSREEAKENKENLSKLFACQNWLSPNILSIPKSVI